MIILAALAPWKWSLPSPGSLKALLFPPLWNEAQSKETQEVRARYDAELPPLISIVRHPGRPVILGTESYGHEDPDVPRTSPISWKRKLLQFSCAHTEARCVFSCVETLPFFHTHNIKGLKLSGNLRNIFVRNFVTQHFSCHLLSADAPT